MKRIYEPNKYGDYEIDFDGYFSIAVTLDGNLLKIFAAKDGKGNPIDLTKKIQI